MQPPFPRPTPSTRVFTPGDYANTARRSMGGRPSVSSHTSAIQGQRLRLSFTGASADTVAGLFFHWSASNGRFGLFALPNEVWSGSADPAAFTPAGYLWKYADVPQVDEIPCGLHDVALELELVPINASVGFVEVPNRGVVIRGWATFRNDIPVVGANPLTGAIIRLRAPSPLVFTGIGPGLAQIKLRAPVPSVTGS